MPDVNKELEYVLRLNDNITPTAEKATKSEEELKGSVEQTNAAMDSQNIQFIKNLESMSAFREGITAITTGMITLGLVSGKNAVQLQKMVAALNIFVGLGQAVKGFIGIVQALKTAEIGLAAVESYRAVLKNPAALGLAVAGLGVAGGVGGFFGARHFANRDSGTAGNTTQNITFNNAQPGSASRGATRAAMEANGDF